MPLPPQIGNDYGFFATVEKDSACAHRPWHVHHRAVAPNRPNQFKMMLSDEEQEMLRELAEEKGLTASDFLRTLIREQHNEFFCSENIEDSLNAFAKRMEKLGVPKERTAELRSAATKIRRARKGQR